MKAEKIIETIAKPTSWPLNVRRLFMIGLPITLPIWIVVNLAIWWLATTALIVLFGLTGLLNMARRMWHE